MQNWDETGKSGIPVWNQALGPVRVRFLGLYPGPGSGPGPVPKVHPGTRVCGSLLPTGNLLENIFKNLIYLKYMLRSLI
jgi:hypothetical protein